MRSSRAPSRIIQTAVRLDEPAGQSASTIRLLRLVFVISFPLSSRPALAAFFSKRSSQPGGLFQYSGDGDEIGVKCEDGFLRGSRGRRDGPRCGPPLAKWKRRGLFFAGPFCSAESGGTRFRLRSGNPNLAGHQLVSYEFKNFLIGNTLQARGPILGEHGPEGRGAETIRLELLKPHPGSKIVPEPWRAGRAFGLVPPVEFPFTAADPNHSPHFRHPAHCRKSYSSDTHL